MPFRCAAQFYMFDNTQMSDQVDKAQGADLDWGNGVFYASGDGAVPSATEEPNRTKAMWKAKGYGKTKAIANMLMAIEGTPVNSKSVCKDYIDKNDSLSNTIEELTADVEVVGEKQQIEGDETLVHVTVKAPMYGPRCIASTILGYVYPKGSTPESSPSGINVEKRGDFNASSISPDAKGPFNSLIVDCSGLNLQRALCPKIRRVDATEVWGTITGNSDFVNDHGIVTYFSSINNAKRNDRFNNNALIIKAAGRAGSRFMCDAVISVTDADRILQEENASHFLSKFNIAFIITNNQ